jgi:6,7-dimethyl-8-ribityllumazine synthase
MYDGALEVLKAWKVRKKNITIMRVPGSFELPFACEAMLRRRKLDAVVAIGCIIRGETDHDKYLASAVAHGLTEISVARGVPVAFGVITPNTLEQARVRSRGRTNHAVYATEAALSAALEARAL